MPIRTYTYFTLEFERVGRSEVDNERIINMVIEPQKNGFSLLESKIEEFLKKKNISVKISNHQYETFSESSDQELIK